MALIKIGSNKNFSILLSGTIISQIIPLISAPLLTRIYDPIYYGAFGLFLSLVSILAVFGSLQYSTAILLPKELKQAEELLLGSFLILFCVSIILGVLIFSLRHKIFSFLGISNNLFLVIFIPVGVFLLGLNTILTSFANRLKRYKNISINRVITAVFSAIVSIGYGLYIKNDARGLILGYIIGLFLGTIFLIFTIFKVIQGINKVKLLSIISTLKKYKNFPKFTLWTELINSSINQLPIFLLGKFIGVSAVGYYNMSNRILGLPIITVSSAISEIFRQKSSEEYNKNKNCIISFRTTSRSLLLLSIIPFLVIILFGGEIFAFIFGEKWREAGIYSQIMGFLFFFKFNIGPLTFVYYLANKQKEDFILHILMLVFGVLSIYIGYYTFGKTYKILYLYSFSYCILYIIYFIRSYQFSKPKNVS